MKSKTITELGILKRRVQESLRERVKPEVECAYKKLMIIERKKQVVPGPRARGRLKQRGVREAALTKCA